jgi:DNA-binding transcriptional ArsR family regulator
MERMTHPTARLDPAIHQPARLGILTAASEAKRIDFVSLRDLLDLTDGNLSRHLSTLEEAGYISIEKTFDGRKRRTWSAPPGRGAGPSPRRSPRCARSSGPSTANPKPSRKAAPLLRSGHRAKFP